MKKRIAISALAVLATLGLAGCYDDHPGRVGDYGGHHRHHDGGDDGDHHHHHGGYSGGGY